MTGTAVIHLELLNDAENVSLVRHVLSVAAEAVGLDESLLADVKTAVSEACANVVLHAYRGAPGPLGVTVAAYEGGLGVVVRDRGRGIGPRRPDEGHGVPGVGLSLIEALTDSVEFRGAAHEGTEVRMSFGATPAPDEGAAAASPEALMDERPPAFEGGTVVAVRPSSIAAPVLGSVIAVLATRARFPVDRLADAQLVTDTLSAHAEGILSGRYLALGIDTAEHALNVRLGPLVGGGASRLVRASAVGEINPLKVLASEIATEPAPPGSQADGTQSDVRGECLRLRLSA